MADKNKINVESMDDREEERARSDSIDADGRDGE